MGIVGVGVKSIDSHWGKGNRDRPMDVYSMYMYRG